VVEEFLLEHGHCPVRSRLVAWLLAIAVPPPVVDAAANTGLPPRPPTRSSNLARVLALQIALGISTSFSWFHCRLPPRTRRAPYSFFAAALNVAHALR
jgi:hypothetical protein